MSVHKSGYSSLAKGLLISCSILLLAACVNNTAADYAKAGDWTSVGYSDGIKGKQNRTASQLKKLGSVNINDYADGYLKGNKEYCNPKHAYQIGISGNYYEGVCEGTPDAQKFRMEWQRGWSDSKLDGSN
ncbi:DUF2799 domain-containing protein [Vibrio sp. S11_S32]|uniref:DUF2799 domain-containing protein n=1 Tax=Vibrio sp. S11_S32 TaxID=2720225 RepID=UPI00167FE8DA|nr:DUF2799 domain-containing protein [Vibrio sp. S11_S32]MBD1575363.1 DUF2799 domain-containing protein [Vibrio sp. S11_S32]